MKHTDGLWLEVSREVAEKNTDIEFEDRIVDNMCMQLVQKPELYDVLVLPNLYGDIVSDLCAGLVGGLGVAPGANFGTHAAVFEPTHGSAPKYAGLNKVNPIAMMLSGVLMLQHLEERAAADRLESAIAAVIAEGTKCDLRHEATGSRRHRGRHLSGGRCNHRAVGGSGMRREKITVVGAGNVGATTAQRLAERDYADVVLVDIVEGLPQGKALDMNEAGPVVGYEPDVVGSNGYEETAGSAICVITSGRARTPGMSRDDLLKTNQAIVSDVTKNLVERSPDTILIVVTNPLDAMCQVAFKQAGLPRERVIGMAGVLDTARFRTFLAWELGVSVKDVTGFVLGGHGDQMVPVTSNTNVAGIPITDLIEPARLAEIVQRTRDGGAEVVKLLKSGSAYYAPSASICEMVDSIVLDQQRVLPAAALLQGEYGLNGLYMGVPCRLGSRGLEHVYEVELTTEEQSELNRSADAVRELIDVMGL